MPWWGMCFFALAVPEPAPVDFAPGLSRSMAVDRSRVSLTVIDRTNLVDEGRVGKREMTFPPAIHPGRYLLSGVEDAVRSSSELLLACRRGNEDMRMCDNFEMPIPSLRCYLASTVENTQRFRCCARKGPAFESICLSHTQLLETASDRAGSMQPLRIRKPSAQ